MGSTKLVAIVLVVLGALALIYNGFSYTTKDTAAKAGPLELKVEKTHDVYVPVWAGVGALVIGGVLLVVGARR
jgi:hypothetical protein